MKFLFSVAIFFALVVISVSLDFSSLAFDPTQVAFFVDFSALLIVLPGSLALALAAGQPGRAGLRLLLGNQAAGMVEAAGLWDFLQKWGRYSLALGLFGALVGMVLMLQNLSDPAKIGPAMAFAILSMTYGVVGKILALAGGARIARRHGQAGEWLERQETGWALLVYPLAGLLLFAFLFMSLAGDK